MSYQMALILFFMGNQDVQNNRILVAARVFPIVLIVDIIANQIDPIQQNENRMLSTKMLFLRQEDRLKVF